MRWWIIAMLVMSCSKKNTEGGAASGSGAAAASGSAAAAVIELDLTPLGKPFEGHVATTPATATARPFVAGEYKIIELHNKEPVGDQLQLSDVVPAAGTDGAIDWQAHLQQAHAPEEITNVKVIDSNEVRFERKEHMAGTIKLGPSWEVERVIEVAGQNMSCRGETSVSPRMRDEMAAICKSIRKK